MDGETGGRLLRHEVPVPALLRVFFIAVGVFVIGIAIWELHRGVWPVNAGSPFFLFLILGACSVGGPAILAGLSGSEMRWTVEPGLVEIVARNPFRTKRMRFTERRVMGFEVRQIEHSEGADTWGVSLVTNSGERFDTRDFGSERTARELRDEMERVFRG